MLKHVLPMLVSLAFAGGLSAQPTSPGAGGPTDGYSDIKSSVLALDPTARLKSVKDSPVAGIKEVQADGQVLYFSDDGKYLIAGDLYEIATKTNVTENARSTVRAAVLADFDVNSQILYGPSGNDKKIYVFTDTTCPYCRRFHDEVPKLVESGVTVQYIAWPRGGTRGEGYAEMQSIWCANDRKQAFDDTVSGKKAAPTACESPLDASYAFGNRLGVDGTPAIFDGSGKQLGGYVQADVIIKALAK